METETIITREPQRVCTQCGAAKSHSEFANNGITPDKKHPYCDPCRRAAVASGWEKRRQAAQTGDNAGTETRNCQAITKDEWWEIFHIALAGCAKRIKEIEDVYEKDSQEARKQRINVMTAMNRLHAAIVAMWGSQNDAGEMNPIRRFRGSRWESAPAEDATFYSKTPLIASCCVEGYRCR